MPHTDVELVVPELENAVGDGRTGRLWRTAPTDETFAWAEDAAKPFTRAPLLTARPSLGHYWVCECFSSILSTGVARSPN